MIVNFARTALLSILLLLWACNFPHYQISGVIGKHFPWLASGSFYGARNDLDAASGFHRLDKIP